MVPPRQRPLLGSAVLALGLLSSRLPFTAPELGRRNAVLLGGAAAGFTTSIAARAESQGTKCWRLEVPQGWQVTKQLENSVAKKKLETLLELQNIRTGARATLLREPLGSISKTSMADPERIMELADAFEGSRQMPGAQVVDILTKGFSDPFKPRFLKWLEVKRRNEGLQDSQDDTGRRYIRYEYETLDCTGAVREAISLDESCRGQIQPRRRHVAVATVGLERFAPERPGTAGPVLEATWTLDASSFADDGPNAEVDALIRSFRVTPTATPDLMTE